MTYRDHGYKSALNLPVGATLRLDWKSENNGFVVAMPTGGAVHTCGNKDFVEDNKLGPILEHYGPRSWSNVEFVYEPDFQSAADLADIELLGATAQDGKLVATHQSGIAVFKIQLPYPFVALRHTTNFVGGSGRTMFSIDEGKNWTSVDGGILPHVEGKYSVWLKAEFAGTLRRLRLQGSVEHNRGVLPYLRKGRNRITLSTKEADLPRGTVGRVAFTYQEAHVADPAHRKRFDGRGISYGMTRTVVKDFAKTPFTFEVDVEGNTPPKMISIERSLRSAK